jgi:hypothetical protein
MAHSLYLVKTWDLIYCIVPGAPLVLNNGCRNWHGYYMAEADVWKQHLMKVREMQQLEEVTISCLLLLLLLMPNHWN